MRRRQNDRVHGPYFRRGKWRVVLRADGKRSDFSFATESKARAWVEDARRQLAGAPAGPDSISEAIDAYRDALIAKGNKPTSWKETPRRLRRFFADMLDAPVDTLQKTRAERLYQSLVDEGLKPDTHRNYLLEARSFLRWCVERGFARSNALDGVKGQGRRTHGKPQLRLDEARTWYRKARELAERGDERAVVALLALLLSGRATELVTRRVRDVDDGGALLWITESKTEAGRRVLEIPADLRPAVLALCRTGVVGCDLPGSAWLFPADSVSGHRDRGWPCDQVQWICELAGVPRVTTHGQRGLHATVGIEHGLSPALVAQVLGHEDSSTTLESYAREGALARAQRAGVVTAVIDGGRSRVGQKLAGNSEAEEPE